MARPGIHRRKSSPVRLRTRTVVLVNNGGRRRPNGRLTRQGPFWRAAPCWGRAGMGGRSCRSWKRCRPALTIRSMVSLPPGLGEPFRPYFSAVPQAHATIRKIHLPKNGKPRGLVFSRFGRPSKLGCPNQHRPHRHVVDRSASILGHCDGGLGRSVSALRPVLVAFVPRPPGHTGGPRKICWPKTKCRARCFHY
jgi:hypothetical protein